MPSERLEQLDSLRGLAAITVVINHMLIVFPVLPINLINYKGNSLILNIITYTPIDIFWQGHSAVLLFFVLSGFVLSLPFFESRNKRYFQFIVKRICRIYIPYVAAVSVAFALRIWVSSGQLAGATDWFNQSWAKPLTKGLILQHYFFLGNYDTNAAIPAIWSLVHEVRISLIFPLLVYIVMKFRWKVIVGTCVLWSILNYGITYLLWHHAMRNDMGWFNSFEYVPTFLIGSLLAKHRYTFVRLYRLLPLVGRLILLGVGVAMYTYNSLLPGHKFLHMADDYMLGIGSSIFIVISLASHVTSKLLLTRPLRFLGRTSYSIYLWHEMILFSLVYVLHAKTHLWEIWVLTLALTLVVAALSHKFIELPCIALGRRLTSQGREPKQELIVT